MKTYVYKWVDCITLSLDLDTAIAELNALHGKYDGAAEITLRSVDEWFDSGIAIDVFVRRLETDDEYAERVAHEDELETLRIARFAKENASRNAAIRNAIELLQKQLDSGE